MPRRNKGARLWLRKRRGRIAQWVILDHGREFRAGAGEDDLRAAESALAEYLAAKRRPQFADGHPSKVLIADVLAEYGENHGPSTRRADLIGVAIGKRHQPELQRLCSLAHAAGECASQKEWQAHQGIDGSPRACRVGCVSPMVLETGQD